MGIRDRFNRVIRADQNSQDSSNFFEPVANQPAIDLEKSITNLRQSIFSAETNLTRLKTQYDNARSEVVNWHQQAESAQKQGDKAVIQNALNRKQEQVKLAGTIKLKLEQQAATVNALKRALEELEAKLVEIQPEPDTDAIASETSQSASRVEDLYGDKDAIATFEQLEEKILQMETRSKEAIRLAEAAIENLTVVLTIGSSVDADLSVLKSQLLAKKASQNSQTNQVQPTQPRFPIVPLNTSLDPRSPQALVDAELEGLKSPLDRLDHF